MCNTNALRGDYIFASIASLGRCNESLNFCLSNTIIDDVRRTILPRCPRSGNIVAFSSKPREQAATRPGCRRAPEIIFKIPVSLYTPKHTSIHPWACKLSNPSTSAGSQLNVSILASSASAVGASAVLVLTNFDSVQEVSMISFTCGPASSRHRRASKLPRDHSFRAKKGQDPSANRRRATDSVLDQSKMQGIDALAFRHAR
jgi:hypothetical protein